MNGLGKSSEVRAGVRASGTGLPADIEKLRPSSNPSWETPRPVRKDGPGGKYHERKRPSKKNTNTQTLLKARMAKGKLNKEKTVEDLQLELDEVKSTMRLTQQLAASRLSDTQFLKAENNKLIIKNKKISEELEDLYDSEQDCKRKYKSASSKLNAKEKLVSKWKRKAETLSQEYTTVRNELKLMENEFLVLKIDRANAMSKEVCETEKREEIELSAVKKLEDMNAQHVSKMSYLTRELEDSRRHCVEIERKLQKTEAEASALQAATHKMEEEVETHFQQAKQMSKVERGEMKMEKDSWKKAMNTLQAENKDLWQQLQFLEAVLLKGEQNDGIIPDNMTLPPVFGLRGKETNRHERDLQIQKATEIRETKMRDLEVLLTEEKTKSELLAGRLSFAEETVHMLMLKNQELEEAVRDAVKSAHEFQDPKLHKILNKKSGAHDFNREPKSPDKQYKNNPPSIKRGGRTFRSGGNGKTGEGGKNVALVHSNETVSIHKLRQDLEYLRDVLREKSDLLVTSIAEQKKLSKQLTNQRELAVKYEEGEKMMKRLRARVHALKMHAEGEHVRLRSELALYGLFEDAEIPHDKHLNPEDLAFHIHERVDNLLVHAREMWYDQEKASLDKIAGGNVVHDAASALVPSFSVQINKSEPMYYEVRKISGCNVMLSVFEGENPPHILFEAYYPPSCATFKMSCPLKTQREILRKNPDLIENSERFEDRIDALVARLRIISTHGSKEMSLVDVDRPEDAILSGKKWKPRIYEVAASNAQEEFAKLMGINALKEEIEKTKIEPELVLPELVLPEETATYFDAMLLMTKKDEPEMLNVSLFDKLEDPDEGTLVVYCSDVDQRTVRYKVTLDRDFIETAVPGALDFPSRRLCREIASRLKISENGRLVLAEASQGLPDEGDDDSAEAEDDGEDEDGGFDNAESAREVAETIFYMIDRDGDGDITRGEMMKAVNQMPDLTLLLKRNKYLSPLLNPKTWAETFRSIDVSSDGRINLQEFQNFAVHLSSDSKERERRGEDIEIGSEPVRVYEGDTKLPDGNTIHLIIEQLGTAEIQINCRIDRNALPIRAYGIFSTDLVDNAVPGWTRVWKRADMKRKVDLITSGLSITWSLKSNEAILLMPGCSACIFDEDGITIDGEVCNSMRVIEHAGKSSREASRLKIICTFNANDSNCVANCNADVQLMLGTLWNDVPLNSADRLRAIQMYCKALKRLPTNSFNWSLSHITKEFQISGVSNNINIVAIVPGFDPRLSRIFIEGFDPRTANHMTCALLKTDEIRLWKVCRSRKWPDILKMLLYYIHFDGFTLSFDWNKENPDKQMANAATNVIGAKDHKNLVAKSAPDTTNAAAMEHGKEENTSFKELESATLEVPVLSNAEKPTKSTGHTFEKEEDEFFAAVDEANITNLTKEEKSDIAGLENKEEEIVELTNFVSPDDYHT